MSKRRRRKRGRKHHPRINFRVRHGLEKLENRLAIGSFFDILAGAGLALAADHLFPHEPLADELTNEPDNHVTRESRSPIRDGFDLGSFPAGDLTERQIQTAAPDHTTSYTLSGQTPRPSPASSNFLAAQNTILAASLLDVPLIDGPFAPAPAESGVHIRHRTDPGRRHRANRNQRRR